jgi:hypothetical protein
MNGKFAVKGKADNCVNCRIWSAVQPKKEFHDRNNTFERRPRSRRRRILVRAWRRGIREMDLVIGGFADAEIGRSMRLNSISSKTLMAEEDAEISSNG